MTREELLSGLSDRILTEDEIAEVLHPKYDISVTRTLGALTYIPSISFSGSISLGDIMDNAELGQLVGLLQKYSNDVV